jgi:hypothetical protein
VAHQAVRHYYLPGAPLLKVGSAPLDKKEVRHCYNLKFLDLDLAPFFQKKLPHFFSFLLPELFDLCSSHS